MSITIEFDGKELSAVAGNVCRLAISGTKTHEVFSFVRLVLIPRQGGTLAFLSGSNGAQTVIRPLHVKVKDLAAEQTILLSGNKLQQIATAYKDSGDKPVKLKIDDENKQGVFSCGRSKMKVDLADPKTYPSVEKVGADCVTVILPFKTFMAELAKAKHAATKNSPRAFCNGVNLAFAQGSMSIISTDGHRLFKSVMGKIDVKGSTHPSVIIPTEAIDYICDAHDSGDTPLVIKLNNTMAEFSCASAQIRTSLIDFEYPNTSSFFSTGKQLLGQVKREDFMQVLNRIRPITDSASQLDIDFEDGEIVIKAVDKSGNIMGEDAFPCSVAVKGKQMRLSCRYLIDALANVDGDDIDLQFDTERQFLMLHEQGRTEQSAIIMPMAR